MTLEFESTQILLLASDVAVGAERVNFTLYIISNIALLTDTHLHDFVIQVLMGDKVSICGFVGSSPLKKAETRRFECQPVIVGSIVKIQMDPKSKDVMFTVSEVEVYGVYGKMALLDVLYYSLLFTSDVQIHNVNDNSNLTTIHNDSHLKTQASEKYAT